MSGAKTRIAMWRTVGAPPGRARVWPLNEPPVQVTTPDASGPVQWNASASAPLVSLAEMNRNPAGRRSVTVTPEMGSLP